jgi:hypothetical protein
VFFVRPNIIVQSTALFRTDRSTRTANSQFCYAKKAPMTNFAGTADAEMAKSVA